MLSDSPKNVSQTTLYDVRLDDAGLNRIAVIAAVRNITGLPFNDAKRLVDSAPAMLATGVSKAAADSAKAELERAGAQASVYPS